MFEQANPFESGRSDITARDVLELGAQSIRDELQDEPAVRAEILRVLGRVHQKLGLYEDALPLVEEAVALKEAQYGNDAGELTPTLGLLG
jgi:serine/threonine-protein kinase